MTIPFYQVLYSECTTLMAMKSTFLHSDRSMVPKYYLDLKCITIYIYEYIMCCIGTVYSMVWSIRSDLLSKILLGDKT